MPSFDVETEEIPAFDLGDTYLFKTYFDEDQLFNQLKKYYNNDKYRFEVPESDLGQVKQTLDDFFYELAIEDGIEDYCVVAEKGADSSEILRLSLIHI